jgi:ribonuclease HI
MTSSSPTTYQYTIHADGGCKGNPGPGGWGAVIDTAGGGRQLLNGFEGETTNNRMELCALIAAIGNIPVGATALVVTDSQYAQKGITEWIVGWKRKKWMNSQGQPVKNKDLWVALDSVCQTRSLRWTWVKGHSGNPGNELADSLANDAIAARKSTRF